MSSRRHRVRLVMVASIVGLAVALMSPASSAAPSSSTSSPVTAAKPVTRSSDSGYTWWTAPLMARTSRSFYFTGVTSDGTQRVYRWSRMGKKKTLTSTHTNLLRRAPDDHNAPALSMAAGKPSLVFYAGHPGTMYVRRTTSGADPVMGSKHRSSFGPAQKMPFGRAVTYAQVLRDGDRVVVLTRYLGRGPTGWYYTTSKNSGRTWSKPAELFDSESHQAYLMLRPFDADPTRLHVTAYYHPKRGPENVIGYREMALADFWNGRAERFTVGSMETVWKSDQAATAAAADSAPTPPEPTPSEPTPPGGELLTAAEPPPVEPPAGDPPAQSVRMLDVGDKRGRSMIFIATWDTADTVPTYEQMIRRPDGTWSRHPIRSAGGGYGVGLANYIPGLSLDGRRGRARVYLGYKDGTRWHLAHAVLGADGVVQAPQVLQSSSRPLARPVAVGRDLMYQRLDRYATYKDYSITVQTLQLR